MLLLLKAFAQKEIQLHGIKVHPGVTIEESPLGGTGLMFEGSTTEKVELLRIPYLAVIDNVNVLAVVQQFQDLEEEWGYIMSLFQICQNAGVLNDILIFFIVIFWFFEKKSPGKYSQLEGMRPYLEILAATKADVVLKYDEVVGEGQYVDHFLIRTMGMNEKLLLIYHQLCEEIPGFDIISKEVYFNLFHVVRSRILEIPHEVDSTSDDFTTNVSLVPIIDFASHSFANNSYFDVDRDTKDILLYLDKAPQAGKFEITISYSPDAMVESFLTTYGFIPNADCNTVMSMEFRLSEYNQLLLEYLQKHGLSDGIQDYTEAAKWLGVVPACQLVRAEDRVFISQASLAGMLALFAGDLAYDNDWVQSHQDQLQQYADNNGEDVDDEVAYLQYCLAHRDVVEDVGFVPVTFLEPEPGWLQHCEAVMTIAAKREVQVLDEAKPATSPAVQRYLATKRDYLQRLVTNEGRGGFEKPVEAMEARALLHFLVSVNPPYPSHLVDWLPGYMGWR